MNVTFYGVRGSCPCSGDRYRRYGGNTSCLVIDIEGDEPLIVDLGTGLRALGDVLHKEVRSIGTPLHATALLTHLHFDHILGISFFGPLHDPGARLTVYGPAQPKGTLRDALHAAVQPPVFPIHMEQFRGELITNDWQVKPTGSPSSSAVTTVIPVAKCPSTSRNRAWSRPVTTFYALPRSIDWDSWAEEMSSTFLASGRRRARCKILSSSRSVCEGS